MEIDITEFYNNADTREYSNSVANSGMANIGEITWNNAQKTKYSFINVKNSNPFLAYLWECGMGDDIFKSTVHEANALFIQCISSDIQERKELYSSWEEYQEASENGQVSGNLFEADGKIYISLDTSMYEGKTLQEIRTL